MKIFWKYQNTLLLLASLLLVIYLAGTSQAKALIDVLSDWGLFGAFIVGMFFVSSFTVAPAAIVLFRMAESMNSVSLAIAAGVGAMLGDFAIFRFMKDRVFEEWRPLVTQVSTHPYVNRLFASPFFS